MPPSSEQQNPVSTPISALPPTTHSSTLEVVRIFLLVLIIIGLGLIATEKLWVAKVIDAILGNQALLTSSTASNTVLPAWEPLEATSTDFGYAKEKGQIIFVGAVNQSNILGIAGSIGTSNIIPADPNSFFISSINPWFAKDSTKVFYTGIPLTIADPTSFEVLDAPAEGGSYAKDKNYAYYEINSSDASQSLTPIPNADAASFTAIGYGYAKDVHSVYLEGKIIPGTDPMTFKIVGYFRRYWYDL